MLDRNSNNMKRPRILILAVLLLLAGCQAAMANTFSTQRLQKIAASLWAIPFDTLSCGTHEFNISNHALVVRVNEWKEVEHIGLELFNRQYAGQQAVVYDFLERYLLELLLSGNMDDALARMANDKVTIEMGALPDLFSLDRTDDFVLSYLGFKGYRMAWSRNEVLFLALSFPMDYQLMSGCNAIELENNYLRDIKRYAAKPHSSKATHYQPDSTAVRYSVEEGGSYLSGAIRHDLYYEKDSLGWSLLCSPEKPYWSAYNIALSSFPVGNFTLDGLLDKYGYETAAFSLPFHDWVSYCEAEGGVPYFGIKSKEADRITGTIIIPYEDKGFCHMMKVEIPLAAIEKKSGEIKGRLFVFVPMHNLYEGYFDYQFIPRKENHE